jgi:hypothetical protein
MASSGMLLRVALVRTDVSEETSASFTQITHCERFEVSTVVIMDSSVFWDIKTQFLPHKKRITSPLQSPAA